MVTERDIRERYERSILVGGGIGLGASFIGSRWGFRKALWYILTSAGLGGSLAVVYTLVT